MKRDKIIEILLVIILLVLVFLMIILGLTLENSSKNPVSKRISNSYYQIDNSENNYYVVKNYPKNTYLKEIEHFESKNTPLGDDLSETKDYKSYGKHTKKYELGFYVDTYNVYVHNLEKGDYFRVRFYFKDYEGIEKTYDLRKYISHDEEEIFYFRDICKDKYKYPQWSYKIFN